VAQDACVVVDDGDRVRLAAIASDRNRLQKHVRRARIVLLPAARLPVAEVARQAAASRPAVWRWQVRYAQAGVDGLLHDKTRPPGRAPMHSVVLSIDEKSQIQALDRTQPGLPLKPGKCGTMTHDYKRNGVTTIFAALNVRDGTVLGRCMSQHRQQEFVRFLNAVERAVPAGKLIHAIADNYATHKHPKVPAWLERHPRWVFHFTPTSASWINAVEGFFSTLTQRRLRRVPFRCGAWRYGTCGGAKWLTS
jgi:hypothetical protein